MSNDQQSQPRPAEFELRVRFYELDPYSHVNHTVYLQYFEAARVAWLSDVGVGLDVLADAGVQLVVTGASVKFAASAVLDDRLRIETALVEGGRVRCQWAQMIWRGDELICCQRVNFATVSTASKPIRVPALLADAMETMRVDADWHAKLLPDLQL